MFPIMIFNKRKPQSANISLIYSLLDQEQKKTIKPGDYKIKKHKGRFQVF